MIYNEVKLVIGGLAACSDSCITSEDTVISVSSKSEMVKEMSNRGVTNLIADGENVIFARLA